MELLGSGTVLFVTSLDRRDLLGTLISDLVLTILSYVAETERTFIRTRHAEGIDAARRRGVRFGRPKLILPENFQAEKSRYESGEITLSHAARNCGMSRTTFWEKAREQKKLIPSGQNVCQ